MPTWAEYQHRAAMARHKVAHDARDAARHRAFDVAAQDLHHKHDRPHFAVGGEGSRTAQDAYRSNYERIFPLSSRRSMPPSAHSSVPAVAAG